MKTKQILQLLAIILTVTLSNYSCSTTDDSADNNNSNNDAEIQQINNTAQSGTWQITSFIDSGQDETSDFNGYNFTFSSNGTITADNGNAQMMGTWSVSDSNSNDDSNDDIDFNMFFNVAPDDPFEDLNDDWDVVSHSSNRIDLIDISGGNGGTDTLTFEKL